MRTPLALCLISAAVGWSAPPPSPKDTEAAKSNYNLQLWDNGKVPDAKGDGPLDNPFLTVFLPAAEKRNGASVVIAPGGSNIMLMYGAEGMEIAERYNDWGVAAFVLTYRLSPRYGDSDRVADAKRAIQLVRAKAETWKLDPQKVGYIGFSAGSNLGPAMAAAAGPGDASSDDPVSRLSSRPDYLALIYGPGRPLPPETLKNFPPTFLCAAQGDVGPALGSARLFSDLTKAGVSAELHLYQKGRHGFGSGFGSPEFGEWMPALRHFLKQGGFLGQAQK